MERTSSSLVMGGLPVLLIHLLQARLQRRSGLSPAVAPCGNPPVLRLAGKASANPGRRVAVVTLYLPSLSSTVLR